MKLLLSRQELAQGVARLAEEINHDYQGKSPLLIAILKGAFVFLADLVRQLQLPVEIDFVQLSSYGKGTESRGRVRVVKGVKAPIKDRDVIVVEDIVDTGLALAFLLEYLRGENPATLRVCALCDKPARRKADVKIDYLGFTVPNMFVVGYGIDWAERYRHLPELWAIEE